ncbi:hypothetical protein PV762_06965 [Mitsuaria sp. CC2]|uniref:hypothetical protein n=1 Tax=Mitsuaria sp. CC2 TaxID=3029186 RepID=UPI003B8DCF84
MGIEIDDEWAAELAEQERDRQRKAEPPPELGEGEFLAWRSPRTDAGGPTSLDNPLWHWLVRSRHSAYSANQEFAGPSSFEAGPMWCFDRYGRSETALPDGRVVHVAGEHEDHYDPDFFIYNDVVIVDVDGRISIHGYGHDVFPPTDFHSATLVNKALYIIGNLGHSAQRIVGKTPVFRIDIETLVITEMPSHGDAPGWISRHSAELDADMRSIIVSGGEVMTAEGRSFQENLDRWSFDLESARWTRLTALDWQRWTMLRVDRKPNRLWDTRHERWLEKHAHLGLESGWRFEEPPDFDALDRLYRPDEDSPPVEEGIGHEVYIAVVDGVRVRFTEDRWLVHAIVEGRLGDDRLKELQQATLTTLGRLDASVWEIEAQ